MDERRSEKITDSMVLLIGIFRIMRNYGEHAGVKPPWLDAKYWTLTLLLNENLPMSELGKRLQRSKPNMTAIIESLAREGMVQRLQDGSDRRIVSIAITKKGERFIGQKRKAVKESIKRHLSRLDDDELDRFCAALEEVNRIAGKMRED